LDPVRKPFQIATFPDGTPVRFNFVLKPDPGTPGFGRNPVDYKVVPDPNGQLQVIEFTAALPRAKLYSNWRVEHDEANTLQTMIGTNFDAHALVLVTNSVAPPAAGDAGQPSGTVEINTNYAPKRIELQADVKVPSVLLLCDRYNPKWTVSVDGAPAELLRCNFIERGVMLKPGKHAVVFQFTGSAATFAVSLTAVVVALGLCGWLAFTEPPGPDGSSNGTETPDDSPRGPAGLATAKQSEAKPGPIPPGNKSKKR